MRFRSRYPRQPRIAPPPLTSAEQGEGQLKNWLREFDRGGSLPEAHAAIDNAFARGHARGLEEGRADLLDWARTVLLSLLEQKFHDLSDEQLDQIEQASLADLKRWIEQIADCGCAEEALG